MAGRPLSPFSDEEWAAPTAARLEEIHSQLPEHRVDALLELGEQARALTELEALRRQIRPIGSGCGASDVALYRSGRSEDALQFYQQARNVLRDELGIEPRAELQRLQQDVLAQDPKLLPSPYANLVEAVGRVCTGARRPTACP